MRIAAIACVRDEIDVIEAFARHTLAFVDHLVVLDNGSSDGTRTVLQSLQGEGLPIEVVDDPAPGKYLSVRQTRLMRSYAIDRCAADWILPLDADEFLATAGDSALVTEQTPQDKPLQIYWFAGVLPRSLFPYTRLWCPRRLANCQAR